MRRISIAILAVLMSVLFIGLLAIQVSYFKQATRMRKEQFDEAASLLDQVFNEKWSA